MPSVQWLAQLLCKSHHSFEDHAALILQRRTHLFLGKPDTEENRKAFVSTIPLGRPSTATDVASACLYLASDEAEFITGIELEVRLLAIRSYDRNLTN